MDIQEFEVNLKADGYTTTKVERAVGYAMGEHDHPFDACALITQGDITLVVNGVSTNYAVGQIFRLPAGTLHHESAGPSGVSYVSARKEVSRS